MKTILQDLLAHTMGFLPMLKITQNNHNKIIIDSVSEDRTIILTAITKENNSNFTGTFGLGNLHKLDYLLKCPEYKENATLKIDYDKNKLPISLSFINDKGDFKNTYRFLNESIINEKIKKPTYKEPKWDIVFEPNIQSIQRMKYQIQCNSDDKIFQVYTEDNNLIFKFGNDALHSGNFIFHNDIKNTLDKKFSWNIQQVMNVLNLQGSLKMSISNVGILKINVDSGIIDYEFLISAMRK